MTMVRLTSVPRTLTITWWIIALFALWAGIILAISIMTSAQSGALPVCHLHRLTGVPCATCGSTRAALALGRGDVTGAFLYNPFVFSACAVIAALFLLRVGFGKGLELTASRPVRRAAWIIIALLFAANWIYVITWHRAASALLPDVGP